MFCVTAPSFTGLSQMIEYVHCPGVDLKMWHWLITKHGTEPAVDLTINTTQLDICMRVAVWLKRKKIAFTFLIFSHISKERITSFPDRVLLYWSYVNNEGNCLLLLLLLLLVLPDCGCHYFSLFPASKRLPGYCPIRSDQL